MPYHSYRMIVAYVSNHLNILEMDKVVTKHFQYTGLDDYDRSLDEQMNDFISENGIKPEQIINVSYAAHSSSGINTYSALLVYKTA